MNTFWVPDWRQAWRWFSVRAMVLAIAIQTAWELAPLDLKTKIPPEWMPYITILVLTAGILGRLVNQSPEKPEPPDVDDPG
jgi:hypothetical protein